jgi:hypothetical protein
MSAVRGGGECWPCCPPGRRPHGSLDPWGNRFISQIHALRKTVAWRLERRLHMLKFLFPCFLQLCWTPMIHAKNFATCATYRQTYSDYHCLEDRPLIAQFCGDDPDTVVTAARYVEEHVDAVDLNLGCPQKVII